MPSPLTPPQVLPHDTYGRDFGLFIEPNLPYILGTNITGIVEKLGPGETKYSIGDHIFGQGNPFATQPDSTGLQQHAILLSQCSALIPSGFSKDQVTAIPVNALTSFAALFHPDYFAFPAPQSPEAQEFDFASQTIVIIGAGSNAGKFGVQWAKVAGIGKVIVVASISHERDLKAMGATHVVDRHSLKIVEEVRKIAGGKDVITHVYDCVNWTYELATELVSSTLPSRILTLHQAEGAVELLKKLGKKNVKAEIVLGSRENLMSIADMFWPHVGQWLKDGKILIPRFRTIEGLDEVAVNEALDSYRDGKPVTQAIVHPWGDTEV